MPKQIFPNISTQFATVLGFSDAGWPDFCEELLANGMHVNTTSTPLLSEKESIYEKHHGKDVIYAKAHRPRQNPVDVANSIIILQNFLMNLKEQTSRRAILTYFLIDVLMEYDLTDLDDAKEFNRLSQQIEDNSDPNQELLRYLLRVTYNFDKNLNNLSLIGYSMLNMLNKSKKMQNIIQGEDQKNVPKLIHHFDEINLDIKGYSNQAPITNCKKLIVDTLQVNLVNLANYEPLIPIKVIIAAENESKGTVFAPSWQKVTSKNDFGRTNVELRMLYKLTKELNHSLINMLMMYTIQFYKKIGYETLETTPPWETNTDLWLRRKRTANKQPHFYRTTQQTQDWVKELYTLADTTLSTLGLTNDLLDICNIFESTSTDEESKISTRLP